MIEVAVIAAVAVVGLVLAALYCSRPGVLEQPFRDVLILAAHQDDCVIMAGEYAIEAISAGKQVRVVYLTCGDREVGSQRAQTRMNEAIASWRQIGVDESNLEFLGLVNSPLNGPSLLNEKELDAARTRLQQIISALPRESAVIIPAKGESHQDHRTLRTLALQAAENVKRDDLLVLETPEYNGYLSLWRAPRRALVYIGRSLPLLARCVGSEHSASAGFVDGERGLVLRLDSSREQRRRKMLEAFVSEDPVKLIRFFGRPSTYRICQLQDRRELPTGYCKLGDNWLGPSVIFMWLMIACVIFAAAYLAAALARRLAGAELLIRSVVIGAAALILIWTLLRRTSLERRGIVCVAAVGLLAGSLGPVN